MLDEMEVREKLVYYARLAYDRQLVRGTGGNLSARLSDREMLITASGLSLGKTTRENLVSVDIESCEWTENGDLQPSKEYRFHADILRLRPHVGAILHVHPPYATAYSIAERDIPRITDAGFKQPSIPRIPYAPGGSVKLRELIINAILEYSECKAVVLEKHGLVAMGVDIENAFHLADLIEEMAQIAFIAENLRK